MSIQPTDTNAMPEPQQGLPHHVTVSEPRHTSVHDTIGVQLGSTMCPTIPSTDIPTLQEMATMFTIPLNRDLLQQ